MCVCIYIYIYIYIYTHMSLDNISHGRTRVGWPAGTYLQQETYTGTYTYTRCSMTYQDWQMTETSDERGWNPC